MATPPPGTTIVVHWPTWHARQAWEQHQAWLRAFHDMPNADWQSGQKWFKARKDAAVRAAKLKTRDINRAEVLRIMFPPAEEKHHE